MKNPACLSIAALLFAFPSFAAPSLSVNELRSRAFEAETFGLAQQARDIARRTFPDMNVLDAGETGADLIVTGDVVRVADGFRVTLELREAGSSKLGGTSSSLASTQEELIDAVASASVDLFRAWKETASLAMAPAPIGDPPGPSPLLQPAGAVTLDLDANLLVAFDDARTLDGFGKDHPEEAAAAWRAVAETGGRNPFREDAAERARQWQAWADGKRAFEDQRSRDTARMRKVLPLDAITDATKIELLVRYTRAYGLERANPLVSLLPMSQRLRADWAVGCEGKQAGKCIAAARDADAARDPAMAATWFGRACAAGDAASCAEAGDRWLRKDTRDFDQAIHALESGCTGKSARACARLARVYEEGDGTGVNLAHAAEIRDRACAAGDGMSCRKLACNATEVAIAADLWRKGCKDGDSLSCTLASVAAPQKAPAKPMPPAPPVEDKRHQRAGAAALGVAVVAGTGALVLALHSDDEFNNHYGFHGREFTAARGPTGGGSQSHVAPIALGAAAAVSAIIGVGLLVWHPTDDQNVSVGATPTGLVLTAKTP